MHVPFRRDLRKGLLLAQNLQDHLGLELGWILLPHAARDCLGTPALTVQFSGSTILETVAAAWLLRKHVPALRFRLVNVVDLCTLMRADVHPHGLDDTTFESYFPRQVPVVFVHHGYGTTVRSLLQGRHDDDRFHVRGYINEGTTTTPFDMVVLNQIDRFHIAIDALWRATRLRAETAGQADLFAHKLTEHGVYTREHLTDMPEVADWYWTADGSDPVGVPPLAHPARAQSFTNA